MKRTNVLTANLKKSVTIAVDPLSVMACRVGACLVAMASVIHSQVATSERDKNEVC